MHIPLYLPLDMLHQQLRVFHHLTSRLISCTRYSIFQVYNPSEPKVRMTFLLVTTNEPCDKCKQVHCWNLKTSREQLEFTLIAVHPSSALIFSKNSATSAPPSYNWLYLWLSHSTTTPIESSLRCTHCWSQLYIAKVQDYHSGKIWINADTILHRTSLCFYIKSPLTK